MPRILRGKISYDSYGEAHYLADKDGKDILSDIFEKHLEKNVVVTISIKEENHGMTTDAPDGCIREAQRF
jgi:hypothetical protein